MQTITPVPGAIGHQQRVKAVAITNSDSLIPFTSTAPSSSYPPLPTPLSLPRSLVPCLLLRLPLPPSSVARSHSLFPSFHPFPRHRPTTLSFRRSDFLLLVSTDVVPIYIRAGRYRKSNFVTSHGQPGFRSSISMKLHARREPQPRKIFPYQTDTTTQIRPSSPLLRDRASAKLFSDSKTFPSLSLSFCAFSNSSAGRVTRNRETHEFRSNC